MPNCFQLIDKSTGEPTLFSVIDEALCNHFNQPIDPEKYLAGWYDAIGFRVACGKSLAEVKAEFQSHVDADEHADYYRAVIEITEYLQERYTTDAFYTHR